MRPEASAFRTGATWAMTLIDQVARKLGDKVPNSEKVVELLDLVRTEITGAMAAEASARYPEYDPPSARNIELGQMEAAGIKERVGS